MAKHKHQHKHKHRNKRVNLLQPELIPPKQRLTLNSMVISWLVVFIAFLSAGSIVEAMLIKEQSTHQSISAEQIKLSEEIAALQAELSRNALDRRLQAQLDATKALLGDKQNLYRKLNAQQGELSGGFSAIMTELAKYHQNTIMLEQIYINGTQISVNGQAKKAEHVPAWLSGFEQAAFLKDKQFAGFKIAASDTGVAFIVSTDSKAELTSQVPEPESTEQESNQQATQGVEVQNGGANGSN